MLLGMAIKIGIKEKEFWEMTIAEVKREIEGYNYRQQVKASYDYQLANLIGISVGRCLSKSVKFPEIEDCYPSLFDKKETQEMREQKEKEKGVIDFMAFVAKHNASFEKRGDDL